MFKTLHIFTRKRILQCKVPQIIFFCFLYSLSFDQHQFIFSDMVDRNTMCYSTLGLANLLCFICYRIDLYLLKYKTNVGVACWINVLFSTMGYWSNVDIFKLIQSWDIDIESMLGSGRTASECWLTLDQRANWCWATLYCNIKLTMLSQRWINQWLLSEMTDNTGRQWQKKFGVGM